MHTIRSDPIRGVAGGVAGVDLIRGCINRIILRSYYNADVCTQSI